MDLATQKMRIHANDANKIIYSDLSYVLNGLFFEAQRILGRFCRERQYADFVEEKLKLLEINYKREKIIPVNVDGVTIKNNRVDFIIEDKILLEFKFIPFITKTDYFQVQRYLFATKLKLGVIINFRSCFLKPKRIINNAV